MRQSRNNSHQLREKLSKNYDMRSVLPEVTEQLSRQEDIGTTQPK